MERPELKLVPSERPRRATLAAAAWGGAVLAAGLLATLCGADPARKPFDPGRIAEEALGKTLAGGDASPAREAASRLRARLTRTPLDPAARTILASLLAETADTPGERAAAVDQTLAATRLVATDEWVGHAAARVLAQCGRTDLALREIRRMFSYAPDDAATALGEIEPFLPAGAIDPGLPDDPRSWLAWSNRLRRSEREDEADARLAALLARWPDDLAARTVAASAAASRDRLDELKRIVPPTLALPGSRETAALLAFRARTKALIGDSAGSRDDAAHAARLAPDDPWVLTLAGDALAETDPDAARNRWTRALYGLPATPSSADAAIWIRYRLARLADRQGRAGDALREWRTILDERPGDGEAKRRVAELTGEGPR